MRGNTDRDTGERGPQAWVRLVAYVVRKHGSWTHDTKTSLSQICLYRSMDSDIDRGRWPIVALLHNALKISNVNYDLCCHVETISDVDISSTNWVD